MPRSCRLLVAAVVGLAWLAPIKNDCAAQEKSAESAKEPDAKPIDVEPIHRAINEVTSAIEALKSDEKSDANEQRAERDLAAQEDMAHWAERLFQATLVSLVFTFIGIVLLAWTLWYTRRAAAHTEGMLREAENTTKAANAAIINARQSSERELRAYVNAQSPTIIDFEVGKIPLVKYWASNTGQTPARRFRHKTGWCFVADPDTFPVRGFKPFGLKGATIEVGGGDRCQQYTALPTVRQDVLDAIRNGEKSILFFGVISYRDIFGRNRRSVFRYCLREGAVLEGPVGAPLSSNLTACTKNNRSN